jgi:hypothetical protein
MILKDESYPRILKYESYLMILKYESYLRILKYESYILKCKLMRNFALPHTVICATTSFLSTALPVYAVVQPSVI